MDFARLVFVIAAKDLRAEIRTKEAINASAAFALVKQESASDAARAAAADARAALGRQLGTEAVSEPSLDLAMLLAREAVTFNQSEQTEGSLLTTLLLVIWSAIYGAFSAVLAKVCMLASRSALPVSSVIASCSDAPPTAIQLWPAASP